MVLVLYGLLVLCVGVIVAMMWQLLRRRPTFGYVVEKRINHGYEYRGLACVAFGASGFVVMPPRYQLKLQRQGQKPNWHDVTEEQYHRAQIGQLWSPYV